MIAHEELTRRFGTPLYVYDLEQVRAGRDQLFASLPPGFCVYYALKANPHPDIAMAVRESAPARSGPRSARSGSWPPPWRPASRRTRSSTPAPARRARR